VIPTPVKRRSCFAQKHVALAVELFVRAEHRILPGAHRVAPIVKENAFILADALLK
jgi:hypothetical protein